MGMTFVLVTQSPGFISTSLAKWHVTSLGNSMLEDLLLPGRYKNVNNTDQDFPLHYHMECTLEQNKDFRELTFSILLRNCCQSPPGTSDLNSSDTFNTYHKLFNKFRCVCEFTFIRQWIKYCNHSSRDACVSKTTGNLTNASFVDATRRRRKFHSIPKNQDSSLQGNGLGSQFSSLRFRINRSRHKRDISEPSYM